MLHKINNLLNGNVVFVGGVSEFMHGIRNGYNDIDIVTPTPDELLHLAPMSIYENKNGRWARMEIDNEKNIDIWIRELPEYDIIDGLKYQTINSMINHYENLLKEEIEDKKTIINKLNRLKR